MRIMLAVFIGLIASAVAEPARADQYKWCAIMGGGDEGGHMNCYFVTLQQCQANVSGVGGFCMPSPFANVPATPTQNQRKKKQS